MTTHSTTEMMMSKREERAARRADLSGAGPVLQDHPPARFPGATGAFALFGEVLLVGILITAGGILLITLPAALAAGIHHLRRYLNAEASPQRQFWRDYRHALPTGTIVGLAALILVLLLLLDIDLANTGTLPGGILVAAIGWAGLAAVATALLTATTAWTPETGWRTATRSIPADVRGDLPGALYFVATAGFVIVATWALPPLIIPALGCAALAAIAVPQRRQRFSAAPRD